MRFTCRVEKLEMTKPCQVKTCMWYSECNKNRCFGTLMLEADELTVDLVAQHKAMSTNKVIALRNQGMDAIDDAAAAAGFVHWVNNECPEAKARGAYLTRKKSVRAKLLLWSQQFPTYRLKSVKWTIETIAVSVFSAYWNKYAKFSGNDLFWLDTLGLDERDIQEALDILMRKK